MSDYRTLRPADVNIEVELDSLLVLIQNFRLTDGALALVRGWFEMIAVEAPTHRVCNIACHAIDYIDRSKGDPLVDYGDPEMKYKM